MTASAESWSVMWRADLGEWTGGKNSRAPARSVAQVVVISDLGEEGEVVGLEGEPLEQLDRVGKGDSDAGLATPDLVGLDADEVTDQAVGHHGPVLEDDLVGQPLPDLRSGDLDGGPVLHEVVDRDGTLPTQPRLEVAQRDRDVGLEAGQREVPACATEVEHLSRTTDAVPQPVDLV